MNNLDTTRSQTFTYDQLNRIKAAQTTSTHASSPTHCWAETYQFDGVPNGAWGNLTQIAASTNPNYTGCSQESGFTANVDANNHLSIFSYDGSGNTQSDGTISYAWNGESQLKSATNAGVTTNYLYDGDGRRVAKVGSKLYWYGSRGDILAETDASGNTTGEYIFFGGKRIAMIPWSGTPPVAGNPTYYVEDMLGTSRVITTNSGVVCYDADFYPYGGERTPYTNTCPTTNNYKFEGKERDTETGNDDFGARYYSNRFGRWLSADWSAVPEPVPYANLTNPQTLNLYLMVADDPESFADLDGHELVPLGQHSEEEITKRKQQIKEELKNKDLTKEQKDALKKERSTLSLEQEGNHIVGAWLGKLDKIGERNGLTLKDFALTTDPKQDFAGASPEQMKQILKGDFFTALGAAPIYIRTDLELGSYQKSRQIQDWSYYGAAGVSHEQVHESGVFRGENLAYQRGIYVFQKFKNFFQNPALYTEMDARLHQMAKENADK